jgi:hypothetical protein
MRECISHHDACDCREAAHAAEVEELKTVLDSVKALYEMALEQAKEDVRLAEIRGASWACEWYWSQGLRHHGANPVHICNVARSKDDEP